MNITNCKTGRKISWRRGGAVLETALVLGILLNLAFGTVEFGYFFYVKNTLQGAAREGARAAIVPGSVQADVTTAVANVLFTAGLITTNSATGMTAKGFTLTTSPASVSTAASGAAVTVTISNTWGTCGIRPLQLIGTAKVIAGTSVMRKEG